jgi:hypothetical protein
MPSRPVLAAIVAFWLATIGIAFHRDVWPYFSTSGPPQLAVGLAEEADPNQQVRWGVYRGEKPVGRLTTKISHVNADDTFWLTHEYQQLEFDFGPATVHVPKLVTAMRVTRAGELREQSMEGTLQLRLGKELIVAEAWVRGEVVNGVFVGHCEVRSSLGDVKQDLEPIPVPAGQALNPLHVSNRLTGVKPGQQWVVHEIDPLGEALAALVKSKLPGVPLGDRKREAVIARVLPEPESLTWQRRDVSCWVIEYRKGEARARTWVRVSDGKVLRQEAFGIGEKLAVEREE